MKQTKSREGHNHKLQAIPDTKRKRKNTESNACKINEQLHEKHTYQLSLPKRGDQNAKQA